ncbi:MAG: UDP-N-acetylmuramoyl-L-alanine--D-glutamate ligase [Kiritimatiellaeota bacterium]|nr:UDP-N-acetylmuramoyl-L-alanine--D-glutamate ligase [Kiritimatiellota bacterium]
MKVPDTATSVLVLGLGRSGRAAAELSLEHDRRTVVLDSADSAKLRDRAAALRARGAEVILGWSSTRWDRPAELAVISPGIGAESVLGRLAAGLDCPVLSELEYGFRHCSCPVLAITGTNGKTTTTQAAAHCLVRSGRRVVAAGNIGLPLSQAARRSSELEFIVAEVSSFQLERTAGFAPYAAAFLNFSSDHFDRYGGMSDYLAAKLRMFRWMKRSDRIVLRHDLSADGSVQAALPDGVRGTVRFRSDGKTDAEWFVSGAGVLCRRTPAGRIERIVPAGRLKMAGRHNLENALAALALCELAGVPPREASVALADFSPGRHRLEPIATAGGVRFINDSKSTNPDSLLCALETASGATGEQTILLIAGGLDKGLDYGELRPFLARWVREVFLVGTCRERLAKQWHDVVSCQAFASLAAAVDAAVDAACPGDTVLLSPGCSSQDMFSDYMERGNAFCEQIERRIGT